MERIFVGGKDYTREHDVAERLKIGHYHYKDGTGFTLKDQKMMDPIRDIVNLESRLEKSDSLVGAYALEIRCRPDLMAQGFCQGTIFSEVKDG